MIIGRFQFIGGWFIRGIVVLWVPLPYMHAAPLPNDTRFSALDAILDRYCCHAHSA